MQDDGVNREGLDYRAGWAEALKAFGATIQVEGIRAKKSQVAGLGLACEIASRMYKQMLDKMRGKE